MNRARAFIGLGSNVGDREEHIRAALAALDVEGVRVAGAGGCVLSTYESDDGSTGSDVLNTVAEVRTTLEPRALLARLQQIEAGAGRERGDPARRTLDLDLLAYEDRVIDEPGLRVPHARCTKRWFVLAPWTDVAPTFVVPASPDTGVAAPVVTHAANVLRWNETYRHTGLHRQAMPAYAPRAGACDVLRTRGELAAWRAAQQGDVGVLMTMGALHAGHGANVQRAVAENDAVLATLFVNPLQFGPGEDLGRYPRTFDADVDLLKQHGANAVYAPEARDLYPDGFATNIVPGAAAEGFEGTHRPGHFAGVATVVLKLWNRTRPDRVYFGRKDAQQVAVVSQMARDLDLDGEIVVCPTVRETSGLALSSRNRFLDAGEHRRAVGLSLALASMAESAAREGAVPAAGAMEKHLHEQYEADVDYVAVVDPVTMQLVRTLHGPALAIGAMRIGDVRLIDNCWIAPPARAAVEA